MSNSHDGKIIAIVGPMFASKSSNLIGYAKRYHIADKKCLVVKYKKDTRYSTDSVIVTHDRLKYTAKDCETLDELDAEKDDYDVILIDEGQFFLGICDFAQDLADRGKTVIISALDTDFERKPFNEIGSLMAISQEVHKQTAVCMVCKKMDACFTKRTINSKEREVIGGKDAYIATCRKCYHLPIDIVRSLLN